ncbi:MAG: TolC family protein [Deltaproteobacteria bacterium]|nr:TolC family protein [Deltaproteobacteria bacterium]
MPEPGTGQAPAPEPVPTVRRVVSLGVKEVIALAIKQNLDLQAERLTPSIRSEDVVKARAAFDPTAFAEAKHGRSFLRSATQAAGTDNKTIDVNLGVRQKVVTGGNYTLRMLNERLNTNNRFAQINPSFSTQFLLEFTQPFLDGFGIEVNTANIRIALTNRDISGHSLRDRALQIISQAQNAYWDLVLARKTLTVRQQSLDLAQELLRITRARVEAGVLARIETVQAESEVASRREAVIVAQNAVGNAEDNLRAILSLDTDTRWADLVINPTDEPQLDRREVRVDESLRAALTSRPDLAGAKLDLQNRGISVRVAQNSLLPSLNFSGTVGLQGLDQTFRSDFETLGERKFWQWNAGMLLEQPLGNRAAKADLSQRRLEQDRAVIQLRNLEQRIATDVRQAVRTLTSNLERIEATRAARTLAEQKVRAEEEKLRVGLSTTFNVQQFQRDLTDAQVSEIQAQTDYQRSLINLERVKGTALETYKVELL